MSERDAKPPYRVPSMREIEALPPNGLRIVSTFSGCGGSCLGFRMAGFRTLWASEFVEAARDTYRANHPGVVLDERDIRTVTAEEILAATGLEVGELDVFEGSPPCASFSTAGKGAKAWGKVKAYSDTKQRTDDLFLEWLRLLEGLKPRAFVAENVAGLVKGKAKGWFLDILARMNAAGYRAAARVLDAQWLGVPQARQRVIFVGIREDLGRDPVYPSPLSYRYSLREALPGLTSVVHDTSGQPQYSAGEVIDSVSPPIMMAGGAQHHHFKVTSIDHDNGGWWGGSREGEILDRPAPVVKAGNAKDYKLREEPTHVDDSLGIRGAIERRAAGDDGRRRALRPRRAPRRGPRAEARGRLMCGIVGGFGPVRLEGVRALDHRGPDASGVVERGGVWLGHTRLAIVDLDARSNQPFRKGAVDMVFNGELWAGWKDLRAELAAGMDGDVFVTESDTEVIAAALARWGEAALDRLDGMFALAWTTGDGLLHLARDRFGEVPLHVSMARPFLFASEFKALRAMGAPPASFADVGPGEVLTVSPRRVESRRRWYMPPVAPSALSRAEAAPIVRSALRAGTDSRAIADVPVCALLSGGIDSAAIVHELARVVPDLVAYVAVMDPKSPDLRAARVVAEAEGVELREVAVAAPTSADLSSVIETIEMPHKAQVEIAWACLALADRMRADGFKVTFSGEGSDELWASYGFAYHALLTEDWHEYRRDLVLTQARKNFARCNKVFLSRGIECRLPFLHRPLVELALGLTREAVQEKNQKRVFQDAYRDALPATVVDRAKLAFQDGLGLKDEAARAVGDPQRFYRAEYAARFR